MRTLCAALLAVLGGGTALPAYARDLQSVSEDARFSVALRSGFGIPLGDVVTGLAAQDLFSGQIPGWIDIGMRNETMFVGAYYQYGYVIPAHCPPGASCSGYTMRLGAEFLNRFMPRASYSPWVGIGIGYEWAHIKVTSSGLEATADLNGFEFLNVQTGIDFNLSPLVSVGPFVSMSVATYSRLNSQSIADTAVHGWLQGGAKCTFSF